MNDGTTELQSSPKIISTQLYEPYETAVRKEQKRRRTTLRSGDRIVCQKTETAWTIAFARNHTYLSLDHSPNADDKLLIPTGMDVCQLVAIICTATGLTATPVKGMSARYMIWEL